MHLKQNIDATLKSITLDDTIKWQDNPVTDSLFAVLHRALHSRAGGSSDYELGRIAGIQEAIELIRTLDDHVKGASEDKDFVPAPTYAKPGMF